MTSLKHVLEAAESLIVRLEKLFPPPASEPNWNQSIAFRWRGLAHPTPLQTIAKPQTLSLDDIQCIESQKLEIEQNTGQFLAGFPANNVLLWGSRGTGKSSLIKALLNKHGNQGLRLIEVDKQSLIDLPDILARLDGRSERFILFCDDLSFEADDPSYKALKAALDGSLCSLPDNVLIYATSNRRHLMPEFNDENLAARHLDGEIHHAESVEEKISLSERFGLWLAFHPFTQDQYLNIVRYWLQQLGTPTTNWVAIKQESLRWALKRGSRSGRVAWQFAKHWSGKTQLTESGRR